MKNNSLYILILSIVLSLPNYSSAQNKNLANKLRLAKQFETLGQIEKAKSIYLEIRQNDPTNYVVYNSLYKILLKEKKYAEAEQLVKEQLKHAKSKVALYGDLGSIYFRQDNSKKAMEYWETAIKLEPDNPFAYRTIANYMIENRLIDDAIKLLEKGNEVSGEGTIFSYDIANYYSITMKFKEATEEYCKILEKKPNQYNLIRNKIFGYINKNSATEISINTIQNYYDKSENNIILKLLCDIYVKNNNNGKAIESIENYEELTTNNGTNIFTFAQNAFRYKNFRLATGLYKIILEKYPQSALFSEAEISYVRALQSDLEVQIYKNLSWKPFVIHRENRLNDYKELLAAYQEISKKYKSSKIGIEAEYRQAMIYQNIFKNYMDSDSIFNKILDEPNGIQYIGRAHFGLGKSNIRKDNLSEAKTHFKSVLSNRTASEELKLKANYYLAKINMWQGEYSKSINIFDVITKNPKNELVNNSLNYLMIINTFKTDSLNLKSFINADYLLEREKYDESLTEFKKIANDTSLFLLKDFAALKYVELLIALNNYKEAVIFLEELLNCDADNIFMDRFLFLLGSVYNYGLINKEKALEIFNRFFDEFPNSIYYSKVQKIISEYN